MGGISAYAPNFSGNFNANSGVPNAMPPAPKSPTAPKTVGGPQGGITSASGPPVTGVSGGVMPSLNPYAGAFGGIPIRNGPAPAQSAQPAGGGGGGVVGSGYMPGTVQNTVAQNPAFATPVAQANNQVNYTQQQERAPNAALSQASGMVAGRYGQLASQEGQTNPYLLQQIQNYQQRLSADPTQQAIDLASQNVRNQADASRSTLTGDLASRGIMPGSGVAAQLNSQIDRQAQQANANTAAQIALGRQGQLDQLVLGGQSIMAAPAQQALQQQGLTNQTLPILSGLAQSTAQNQLGNIGAANQAIGLSGQLAGNVAQNQLGQQQVNLGQYQTDANVQLQQQQMQMAQAQALAQMQMQQQAMANQMYGGGF